MATTLTVWHNITTDDAGRLLGMLDGYAPGHCLVPVARRELPITFTGARDPRILTLLEEIWRLLNVGDDPAIGAWAVQYRGRRNRSLSIGDVAQLTPPDPDHGADLWFTVATVGWTPIESPPWFAIGASRHGTTPLPPGT